MKLNPIAANVTEVEVSDKLLVLFSYKTPVACRLTNDEGTRFYKTTKKWSASTSRHINKWLKMHGIDKKTVGTIVQELLDNATEQCSLNNTANS